MSKGTYNKNDEVKTLDKYEYRTKTDQMLTYIENKRFGEAVAIADTIDWRRVRNVTMLCTVSDAYERAERLDKSRELIILAFERSPDSRKIVYRWGMLALKMELVGEAMDCYEEFISLAPRDPNQYILKYKILKIQGADIAKQIETLVEFKKVDYVERWAYELAKLYHEAGRVSECLAECDDLILWFGDNKYVYRAMEIKMHYKPLTPAQQQKYDAYTNKQRPQGVSIDQAITAPVQMKTLEEIKNYKRVQPVAESNDQSTMEPVIQPVMEPSVPPVAPAQVNNAPAGEELQQRGTAVLRETGGEVAVPTDKTIRLDASEIAKVAGLAASAPVQPIVKPVPAAVPTVTRSNPVDESTGKLRIDEILAEWEGKQKEVEETMQKERMKVAIEAPQELSPEIQQLIDVIEGKEPFEDVAEEVSLDDLVANIESDDISIKEESEVLDDVEAEEVEDWDILEEVEGREKPESEQVEEDQPEVLEEVEEESQSEAVEEVKEEIQPEAVEKVEEEIQLEAVGEIQEEIQPEVAKEDFEEIKEADEWEMPEKADEWELTKDTDSEESFEKDIEDIEGMSEAEEFLDEDENYHEYEDGTAPDTSFGDEDDFMEDDDERMQVLEEEKEAPTRMEKAKAVATGKTAKLPTAEIAKAVAAGGSIGQDTGFIVQARYDLDAQSEVGLRAGLTEDQKKLFSYFVPVRGMSEQLVDVLEKDTMCKDRYGTSKTGNLLVIGRKGSGKTVLAVDVVKAIQKNRHIKQGKVAIVTGESLNKKKISDIIDKLYGGALIIEKANGMNEKTIVRLNKAMERETGEMLIVLEDERKPLDRILASNMDFRKKFTSRLEVPIFINDELVTFAQAYAKENGYKIDEMGILALYSQIDTMQREESPVTVAVVKDMIDDAINHSRKLGMKKIAKRLFGKGVDESKRIILTEKNFNS